ncbi:beta-galactosidase family protein [Saccharopolyspora taberi]
MSRRRFLGAAGSVTVSAAMLGGPGRMVVAEAAAPGGLTVDGDRFLLDGKPFQIISGGIHYFRIHPDLWRDRLNRMRMLGLNTVETYVAWNFHEQERGEVDFSGWRDFVRFIEIAGELGLKVVFRPGPYVCAEWEFGGFPAWLLENPDQALRSSDPTYLEAVDTWFAQLLPRVAPLQATRGGPVIAVQVENEYGSYGNDTAYLQHLADQLRANDIDSLLFCCNGASEAALRDGNLPGTLATVNFAGDPTGPFETLRKYQPEGPLWCTEYWDGWFDHWGEQHHTTDPAQDAANVDKMLAAGASINLYMAAGSTNFEWWSGANYDEATKQYQPTITSYDYDAPVSEAGDLTEKFHKIREVIGRYTTLPDEPLPEPPARLAPQSARPTASVGLLDSLDRLTKPVTRDTPVPMEQVGQAQGLIHYRTSVQGPLGKNTLTISQLGDRAWVFLDGERKGELDRNQPDQGVEIEVTGESARLDILVGTGGRINFGHFINDTKGIRGDVRLGGQLLSGWEIRPLPMNDLSGLRFSEPGASGPAFHRATLRIDAPADGFLELPGWNKGALWLNGFLLGRYWHIGPQRTLYAPAPLWREGDNELIALELNQPGESIELRAEPDLG